MGAGEEDLASARLFAYVHNIGANTVAAFDVFTRQSLIPADNAFGAAKVNNDVAIFDAFDDTVDDFADAVFKLGILTGALGVADFAHDNLFGHLRLNPAKFQRRELRRDQITDLRVRIIELRGGKRRLHALIFNFGVIFDNGNHAAKRLLARIGVQLGADIQLGAVA